MCRYGAAFHGATHARRDTFHCLLHSSRPFLSSSVFLARSAAPAAPKSRGVRHAGMRGSLSLPVLSALQSSFSLRPLSGIRSHPRRLFAVWRTLDATRDSRPISYGGSERRECNAAVRETAISKVEVEIRDTFSRIAPYRGREERAHSLFSFNSILVLSRRRVENI